jgi:trk system potassium uptake protein
MNIIIVGAGIVGTALANQMQRGGHQVAIIDPNGEALNAVQESMDIMTFQGSGVNPSVLQQADIAHCDILVAVTPIDEINIVVCGIGKYFNVQRRFARIRNDELAGAASSAYVQELGVTDIIQPEKLVVERVMQYLSTPGVNDAANFHNNELLLRAILITKDMPLEGKTLKALRDMRVSDIFLVVAVVRESIGVIPMGDFVLKENDIAFIVFQSSSLDFFFTLTNKTQRSLEKIIVSGNSLIGEKLCLALEKMHIPQIVWINPERAAAEKAAAKLNSTQVLMGDGMEVDLLRELNISHADFFISVSEETDNNIISALLARSSGVHETIAITDDPRFNDLFLSIGISHVLSPRLVMAQEIISMIRGGHFGLVMRVGKTDLDVIHLIIGENSIVEGHTLEEVWKMVKAKFLVGSIKRGDDMFIPSGPTILQSGDDIIIITKHKNRNTMHKLFKARQ